MLNKSLQAHNQTSIGQILRHGSLLRTVTERNKSGRPRTMLLDHLMDKNGNWSYK